MAGEVLAPAMVAGTQFVADFGDCRCAPHLLDDAVALEAICVEAVRRSGLTAVATRFHQFQPGGATGMVLLAESHLAIHTWPESHFASIDLYVCNFSEDNTAKAEALLAGLKRAFLPALPSHQRVARGRVPRG